MENEIEKDSEIKVYDAEETCEAPKQKDFATLEVVYFINYRTKSY